MYQDRIANYRATARSLDVVVDAHAKSSAVADPATCGSAMADYAQKAGALVERMKAMSGGMDQCMTSWGLADRADLASGCAAIRSELDAHAKNGCSAPGLAAEMARHAGAMRDHTNRERDRMGEMEAMGGWLRLSDDERQAGLLLNRDRGARDRHYQQRDDDPLRERHKPDTRDHRHGRRILPPPGRESVALQDHGGCKPEHDPGGEAACARPADPTWIADQQRDAGIRDGKNQQIAQCGGKAHQCMRKKTFIRDIREEWSLRHLPGEICDERGVHEERQYAGSQTALPLSRVAAMTGSLASVPEPSVKHSHGSRRWDGLRNDCAAVP